MLFWEGWGVTRHVFVLHEESGIFVQFRAILFGFLAARSRYIKTTVLLTLHKRQKLAIEQLSNMLCSCSSPARPTVYKTMRALPLGHK